MKFPEVDRNVTERDLRLWHSAQPNTVGYSSSLLGMSCAHCSAPVAP